MLAAFQVECYELTVIQALEAIAVATSKEIAWIGLSFTNLVSIKITIRLL
jgi:hypothetical protein